MHEETLSIETKKVLEKIQTEETLKAFYLAGGTALALQLGHRKSVDLDFFSQNYPAQEALLQNLNKYKPTVVQQDRGTLDVFIDKVKVSFFEYKYPLLEKTIKYKTIELAQLLDIACMKIAAISQRGTKKDFVDLYMLLQKYSLDEILKAFEKKYSGINYHKLHILKSLVYFDDADSDPEPDYLLNLSWNDVKTFITSSAM
ncbi:nucleotidyl transferase AbiEii/AbiGii toxin family protein [Patescibacteria group bacterium]|nr:nucleotidyl transferase AbiEii/AbiGii toxin family protein [Patescibacteria group bacterium]MBU1953225.1 nucleotidyl transferase AbiEii/AbiGii toxin family protein [Patescibacteria group bacterium]